MTMHSDHHNHSFTHTAGGQTIILTVVLLATIAFAWAYVW